MMAKYNYTVCSYIYDEEGEGTHFDELSRDWKCTVCNAPREAFEKAE